MVYTYCLLSVYLIRLKSIKIDEETIPKNNKIENSIDLKLNNFLVPAIAAQSL